MVLFWTNSVCLLRQNSYLDKPSLGVFWSQNRSGCFSWIKYKKLERSKQDIMSISKQGEEALTSKGKHN